MFSLEELKIIEIIQEHQKMLFQTKIICNKNQTETLAFSIGKTCFHMFMLQNLKDNFDYSIDFSLSKICQYELLAFFGDGSNITGTHYELKDPRKFWSMFALLIKQNQYPSLHLKQIEESVKIYGRMKIPLSGRNYAAYCLLITDLVWREQRDIILRRHLLESQVSLNDIVNLFDRDVIHYLNEQIGNSLNTSNSSVNSKSKSMIVYRGFDIEKNENVRKNRFKVNNNQFQTQDAGIGISYSYNKQVARDFSTQKFGASSFILNNLIEDRVSHASLSLKNLNIKSDDFLDVSNRTPYVGKYELEKKDVILDISNFLEDEVMAFPSSAKLIDYRASSYS